MTASLFSVNRPAFARFLGTLAAGSLVGTPLMAQVAPPPVLMPQPVPQATPPAITTTPIAPSVAAPVAIPTLSEAQARQLATLIAQAEVAQGLRQGPPRDLSGLSPAALVRVALDYAHAVHAGRLDASDFTKDWGIRPQPFDPAPGFADAIAR